MAEDNGNGNGNGGNGTQDDLVKKAHFERDSAIGKVAGLERQLKELQGKLPTEDQVKKWADLETAAAKAEEERQKKAGEWDSLRSQLVKNHETALTTERERGDKYAERFRSNALRAEFGGAVDWFGPTAKTILDPGMAIDVLGKYVTVEDDESSALGYRVIVKLPNGSPVVGADGNPAPFAEAIGKLVEALPNKDRILRGSGKTGSGSSGGSGRGADGAVDLNNLKPADFRDPKVREAVKQQQAAAGGLQIGPAFTRAGR